MEEHVIPILRVAYAADAIAWYERLGFIQEWEHCFDPGSPAFVSIARGRARLFLSGHQGDARPDTLVQLAVNDVDAVLAEFGRLAGESPYGCEFELRDPDGNRLRITRQQPEPTVLQSVPSRSRLPALACANAVYDGLCVWADPAYVPPSPAGTRRWMPITGDRNFRRCWHQDFAHSKDDHAGPGCGVIR